MIMANSSLPLPAERGSPLIRSQLELGGLVFERTSSGMVAMTYCAHVDPKGKIPPLVTNFFAPSMASILAKIRTRFEGSHH